jgi:hypothetical protein
MKFQVGDKVTRKIDGMHTRIACVGEYGYSLDYGTYMGHGYWRGKDLLRGHVLTNPPKSGRLMV